MIASTLKQACEAKLAAEAQGQLMNISPHKEGWQLVNRFQGMPIRHQEGLKMAYEWHRSFPRSHDNYCFHPMQFEIYNICSEGKGPALAIELQQLHLLQSHEGRFWISQAGLNMMESVSVSAAAAE